MAEPLRPNPPKSASDVHEPGLTVAGVGELLLHDDNHVTTDASMTIEKNDEINFIESLVWYIRIEDFQFGLADWMITTANYNTV